jgi:ABC-type Zn uptake system ZnuABC Zn-binding protein ZnuA
MYRLIVILIVIVFALTACGGQSATETLVSQGTSAPVILTSTTFLADITRNVTGERAQVESLLPVGTDPHTYEATPSDVTKIAESKVLILNGIEYEHFIEALIENAGGERLIITASDGLEPRHMEEHEGEEHASESGEAGHEAGDPHMWLEPNHVMTYIENIRAGLTHADPAGAVTYQANADAYASQLKDLDTWITEQVAQIPQERRLLVTNHDSLGYFAEQYGFTVIGTIVPGVSSAGAPSAQEIAMLIDEIKVTGAPAVFLNIGDNSDLADQIAAETDIKVVTDLYIETLSSPDGPAPTYIDMMKYNVSQIVDALK